MDRPAFSNQDVRSAFDAMPEPARAALLHIRDLIFATAAATEAVGPLEETLKWGQPAYLTPATRSGSTIRLGIPKSNEHDAALFDHCQTDLTRRFEAHYPGLFAYEGTRALLFEADKPIPEAPLRHCIAMALTYHRR